MMNSTKQAIISVNFWVVCVVDSYEWFCCHDRGSHQLHRLNLFCRFLLQFHYIEDVILSPRREWSGSFPITRARIRTATSRINSAAHSVRRSDTCLPDGAHCSARLRIRIFAVTQITSTREASARATLFVTIISVRAWMQSRRLRRSS